MKIKVKFLLTLCAVALMAFCMSCSQKKSKLQEMVDDAAKQCPLSLGNIGSVSSFAYADGEVTMEMLMNEELFNVSFISQDLEASKSSSLKALAGQPEDLKAMMQEMIKENVTLVYRYVGDKTHEVAEIRITPQELSDVLNATSESIDYEEELGIQVNAANKQCPNMVDQATRLDSVFFDNEFVTYEYTIIEEYTNFETIEESSDIMKHYLAQNIQNNLAAMSLFLRCCVETGRGMQYHYVGDTSHRDLYIQFSKANLEELMK